jgi:hypothetical protein
MDYTKELGGIVNKVLKSGRLVGVIDTDVSSFVYLHILQSLGEVLKEGKYLWIVSYEPLQSLLRDLRMVGIEYGKYLGKNVYILDVFGSMKHIDPHMVGVFVLSGYLDDRVFVLKYRKLLKGLIEELNVPLKDVIVLGYLESGICRLFDNPVRTQKLLWNLRGELGSGIPGIITYIKPECPELEEFIYLYADFVFEGILDIRGRRLIMTKGD